MTTNEIDLIKQRYEHRKSHPDIIKHSKYFLFDFYMQYERERCYLKIINKNFEDRNHIKLMEIGAGNGINIHFFIKNGLKPKNIFANELLDERLNVLNETFSSINITPGDASNLHFNKEFDIVFQSTVFTSILDISLKEKIAKKMWEMKNENGIIIWYDFLYDNPANKDVKGISKKQIRMLFPHAKKIKFHKVTLAPFIGRRVGRFYHIINTLFPFLRTHTIALIH